MLIHPSDIKISKRFDIYPKLLYAKRFANNTLTKYEHDVYYHHTKVYNNFTEFDDPTKVGYEKFIDRFDDLLIDASANILFTKHVLTSNLLLINGLHRVSTAIAYNQKIHVKVDSTSEQGRLWWPYWKNFELYGNSNDLKNLDADYAGLQEVIKQIPNAKVLVVTPNSINKQQVEQQLKSTIAEAIIYKKSLKLTKEGYLNLNNHLYGKEDWANLETLTNHTTYCTKLFDKCTKEFNTDYKYDIDLYLIDFDNCNISAEELKYQIRQTFTEKYSTEQKDFKTYCHINDTFYETVDIVRTCFSNHSEDFLNKTRFILYKEAIKKFSQIHTENIDLSEKLALTGSSVLDFFVERSYSSDIDIIVDSSVDYKAYCRNRRYVGSYNYYGYKYLDLFDVKEFNELIYDPRNYFWLYGMKIIKPRIMKTFYENRYKLEHQQKDYCRFQLLQFMTISEK